MIGNPSNFTVNHTNLKLLTKWNLCSNAGAYVIGKKEMSNSIGSVGVIALIFM